MAQAPGNAEPLSIRNVNAPERKRHASVAVVVVAGEGSLPRDLALPEEEHVAGCFVLRSAASAIRFGAPADVVTRSGLFSPDSLGELAKRACVWFEADLGVALGIPGKTDGVTTTVVLANEHQVLLRRAAPKFAIARFVLEDVLRANKPRIAASAIRYVGPPEVWVG